MEINKKSTMEAWKEALHQITRHGDDFLDREQRTCRELLNLTLTITEPSKDIDAPIRIMQNTDKWVYPSKDELKGIMLERPKPGVYEYTYGPRIFNFANTKDQINEFILPLLKQDRHSRRAAIILYDPVRDSNFESENIPSLILIQFKIKDDKLFVTAYIRSNDYYIGWPANVYQIFVLQEYLADKLNTSIGSLTTFSASAHVFEEHFEDVEGIIK